MAVEPLADLWMLVRCVVVEPFRWFCRPIGTTVGVQRSHDFHAVERKGQLNVHRLLHPEGAIVVEGRDALLDRHEVRSVLRCDARDEVEDRSFGGAVVPGRQRIALRLRVSRRQAERTGQDRQHRQRREQDAAIDGRKSHDRFHGQLLFVEG